MVQQTPEKGALFTKIVLEVFKTSGFLNTEGDRLTQEFGITSSRWKILGAIHFSPAPLTVPQIGRSMGQSRQAVQRLVDVMAKDNLVELIENPNHKRAKYVRMTSKAKTLYQKLDEKQIIWANACAKDLNTEDMERALAVIQSIGQTLDQRS